MDRGQMSLFIKVCNMKKTQLPTSFLPLIDNSNKFNQSCANIITALDEVNATELEDIDYDFLHNIVDSSMEARVEY